MLNSDDSHLPKARTAARVTIGPPPGGSCVIAFPPDPAAYARKEGSRESWADRPPNGRGEPPETTGQSGSRHRNIAEAGSTPSTRRGHGLLGNPKVCTPLWTATTENSITSSNAVLNGAVYVGSADFKLHAYALP